MSLIDLILNLAGLLLWLSWRSVRFDPVVRAAPATLAGTVRRAGPTRLKRWHFLAAVLGLLFVRALFYLEIGPAVNWTPKLDLAFVVLAFRGDVFVSELLFSLLSFAQTLIVFYFWLLAIAVINRRVPGGDPLQKLVLLQLGRVGRWPRWAQAVAPVLGVAALWIMLYPLLTRAGVLSRAQSNAHVVEQSLLVGGSLYLSLKYLLPAFLFLHLIASYVYLGDSPLWEFIGTTARNILAPLKPVPTRVGKFDFAPLIGIVLILLALHALPEFIRSALARRNLLVWPP